MAFLVDLKDTPLEDQDHQEAVLVHHQAREVLPYHHQAFLQELPDQVDQVVILQAHQVNPMDQELVVTLSHKAIHQVAQDSQDRAVQDSQVFQEVVAFQVINKMYTNQVDLTIQVFQEVFPVHKVQLDRQVEHKVQEVFQGDHQVVFQEALQLVKDQAVSRVEMLAVLDLAVFKVAVLAVKDQAVFKEEVLVHRVQAVLKEDSLEDKVQVVFKEVVLEVRDPAVFKEEMLVDRAQAALKEDFLVVKVVALLDQVKVQALEMMEAMIMVTTLLSQVNLVQTTQFSQKFPRLHSNARINLYLAIMLM
ncbi:hypothetical protein LSTR_LSTR012494 [Laodelphax striatellus]|uniref:Uncharacterized protein n=1 Tax=Laodelphax striatellus TaxID=195883 RepID=A0A482XM24_LAOST|nr:hypothetical protein LSTR_LSTR012494 [Laodelphax striatellus]